MLSKFYSKIIIQYPIITLIAILAVVAWLGFEGRKLEIDASAETLLLENDQDLTFMRLINQRFKSDDFLVITYTPKQHSLLDSKTLANIQRLSKDLTSLDRVKSVTSILTVPLLASPPKPVKELLKNVPTLTTLGIDKKLAKNEFLTSSIYKNNLVSKDFKTTALLINLHSDNIYQNLLNARNQLRDKHTQGTITLDEKLKLGHVQTEFKNHRDKMRIIEHKNINNIRGIITQYHPDADIFLGGVSMIADDLITFIKRDLSTFGVGVLVLLILALGIIFRRFRWIALPIITCSLSVIITAGLLGIFGWEVTVISSNFVSIQIIITMAITIHLIIRYRELVLKHPGKSQQQLVLDTVTSMAKPCSFAILTTVAGFGSLILCDILPVINFGWMMSAGISISLILTFLIFPILLVKMKKVSPHSKPTLYLSLPHLTSNLTQKHGKAILWLTCAILILSLIGTTQLKVENSFIDYFKENTEIYQGMKVIDQQLGGTTPLDIVLSFDEEEDNTALNIVESKDNLGANDEEDDFADFEDEFNATKDDAKYWFTADKMAKIEQVHDYLNSLPAVGKVISLGTMLKVGKSLNKGKPLDGFMLALIYNELPEKFRKIILSPYVSIEHNQVKFAVRIRDSMPDLRRNELLNQIKQDLHTKLGLDKDKFRLTSLLVIYNNMLQNLFSSQILTLGFVLIILLLMFIILFRSLKVAIIALFPNLLSISVVLGFMGWVGIPLDMMTITIAAISMGIAVDDTIHYIHRFKLEFLQDKNYLAAMHRSHMSIGNAMYYTSITIVIGFSILMLSQFIPSIYFGMLTGLAMIIALIASLTLLPQLLITFKPFGTETK